MSDISGIPPHYFILEDRTTGGLASQVREAIKGGYWPCGGVVFQPSTIDWKHPCFFQAMTLGVRP